MAQARSLAESAPRAATVATSATSATMTLVSLPHRTSVPVASPGLP
jgi:hypothetical protein